MKPVRADLAGAALVLLVLLAILVMLGFHLCLNDYWAWSFFASRMSFADAGSFHNGFMPPAYALFLKLVGPARELAAAFVATLLAAAFVAFATLRLARRSGIAGAGVAALLLLLVFPPFLISGLTAGPDIVVAALVAAAVLQIGAAPRGALFAGGMLGLAILVRGHALLAAVALLVALCVARRSSLAWRAAVGVVLGVLVQLLVNLGAGEPAWSNAQAFNVYKMVHGMDWYAPVVPEGLNALQVFRDDPRAFVHGWAGAAFRAGIWLAGPVLAWLHAGRHDLVELRRTAGFAILVGVLYVLPVSLGDSPRAMVVLTALLVAPVAGLVTDLRRRRPSPAGVGLALAVGVGVAASLGADRAFLEHNFRQARDFTAVERALVERQLDSAREVFTEDFDLYFRDIRSRRPLTKGGWGLVGIEGWEDEFPQLPTDDRSAFLESCADHGVRFLALTRRSRRLGPEFSRFYYDPTATGLTVVGEYGEFVLLELPHTVRANHEARP